MDFPDYDDLAILDFAEPIWSHFFTVSPLVLFGTRDVRRTEIRW